MESKEALKRIELAPVCECDDYDGEPYIVGTVNDSFENDIKIVEKDLDRLEKYDKAKELIKKKYVDIRDILYISKGYVKELWLLVYNQNHSDNLTQEEFDFILKIFK